MTQQAPHSAESSGAARAERFNRHCHCVSLDRAALRAALVCDDAGAACAEIWRLIDAERPRLFADAAVFVAREDLERMAAIINAIEQVTALPAYQEHVLAWAPALAHRVPKYPGVFLGYDFHLGQDGPQLIEINTNAGGGLLNAALARAHRRCCHDVVPLEGATLEQRFLDMFRQEWQAERGDAPLKTIAIVDEQPAEQFLYPEFLLFQQLFRRAGLTAVVCDPSDLAWRDGVLWHGELSIDLVYNRLTDFSLDGQAAIRAAYESGGAVVTPHPHAHALYADKRNLIALTDMDLLATFGVSLATRAVLAEGIPRTEAVRDTNGDELWARRKHLFFKPAGGFGSKAAYRGDKLTKRVFAEILSGEYVAQAIALPGERHRVTEGAVAALKVDLRHYVYRSQIQLSCARLYQGQTTNFRTPGGGFAPVVAVEAG